MEQVEHPEQKRPAISCSHSHNCHQGIPPVMHIIWASYNCLKICILNLTIISFGHFGHQAIQGIAKATCLFHLFRLFRTGGGTEQNKADALGRCLRLLSSCFRRKRSKPVRSAKAALTRFGSVLRGTMRPCELHFWQLHCETLPSGLRRSGQRLAAVPRPASPVLMRRVSEGRNAVPVRRSVPESGQPAAGLSPPGAAGAFPPNKGKAVARLLPAPRSGCLPQPFPSHTRSRQETRPGIPPGPPRGRQSPGLRRTPLHRKC